MLPLSTLPSLSVITVLSLPFSSPCPRIMFQHSQGNNTVTRLSSMSTVDQSPHCEVCQNLRVEPLETFGRTIHLEDLVANRRNCIACRLLHSIITSYPNEHGVPAHLIGFHNVVLETGVNISSCWQIDKTREYTIFAADTGTVAFF